MKKGWNIILLLLFIGSSFIATAQTKNSYPWISKDVQKVANKKMLNDRALQAPSVALSKGVHKISHPIQSNYKGNVVSKGYPYWAISKGVQQIGRK